MTSMRPPEPAISVCVRCRVSASMRGVSVAGCIAASMIVRCTSCAGPSIPKAKLSPPVS